MQFYLGKNLVQHFSKFDELMVIHGEVFRCIKNRETLRFTIDNKAYFIKKHFGVGWKELFKNLLQLRLPIFSAKNELLAIQKLQELDVPTMTIAGFGQRGTNPLTRQSFVITEELANTINLEDIDWPKQSFSFKKMCIKKIADIARTLHSAGLNHRDFYLCHFLWNKSILNPIFYLIDLHRGQLHKKVPLHYQIKDLAGLYFSAMDLGITKRDILRFLNYYFSQPWHETIKNHKTLLCAIEQRAKQLYRKTITKKLTTLLHDKKRFIKNKNKQHLMICDRKHYNNEMQALLANPDDFISKGEALSTSESAILTKIRLSNQELVIKQFTAKSLKHDLKHLIGFSPAINCWRKAHYLQLLQIATPKPIAILEQYHGLISKKEFFITKYIAGHNAKRYFTQIENPNKKTVAKTLINALLILRKNHIRHNDTKAYNFIITENTPYFIDLESMHQYPHWWYKLTNAFAKDKQRFIQNWQDYPDIKRLFLELYGKIA